MTAPNCSKTVLVVEDDRDVREAIIEVLVDGDYNPLHAANGVEALELLRTVSPAPCVILLDMMMPTMDGSAFRAAQQENPAVRDIPVVVLSAHADARTAAAELGAAAYLKKPVTLDALLATVARFCVNEPA
jgi:two-component system, OmpR family, response regulator CpxR